MLMQVLEDALLTACWYHLKSFSHSQFKLHSDQGKQSLQRWVGGIGPEIAVCNDAGETSF